MCADFFTQTLGYFMPPQNDPILFYKKSRLFVEATVKAQPRSFIDWVYKDKAIWNSFHHTSDSKKKTLRIWEHVVWNAIR